MVVVVVMADCWSGCSVTTAPISRKLSEDPTSAALAPIISELSNHTLSVHPPAGSSQGPLSFFSDKRIPCGREGSLERADIWLYTEVAISQCHPRHPPVPPVENGSSMVILIKELMGKVCPSTGTFICLLKVKSITAGLPVY